MAHDLLFQSPLYKAEVLQRSDRPVTIVAFQTRNVELHPVEARDFGSAFLPAEHVLAEMDANFVGITASRNCWYLSPDVAPALAAVREAFGHTRRITYGSSLGAFAAFNLAPQVGADYAVGLSPITDISPAYLAQIGDRRFLADGAVLDHSENRLVKGELAEQRGLVFYDNLFGWDQIHAQRIAALTRCELVEVPSAGHPCGRLLNEVYPLRQLLRDMVAGELPVQAIRDKLLTDLPQRPEYKSMHEETFETFLAECRADPSNRTFMALSNAAAFLRDQRLYPGERGVSIALELRDWVLEGAADAQIGVDRVSSAVRALALAMHRRGRTDLATELGRAHLPQRQLQNLLATLAGKSA